MPDPNLIENIRQQAIWYGRRARRNQVLFMSLKTTQLVLAAAIPVLALAAAERVQWATAVLGAMVGILESVLQLGQFQQTWLLFRSTREALRREDFLHLAKAGPYAADPDPDRLYAVRADAIMAGENTKWLQAAKEADAKSAAS